MQEINYARQESSAQSSDERAYRCRVCDGPVEWPRLVCRKCWRRETEEQEWESYLEFVGSDDATPGDRQPQVKIGRRRAKQGASPMLVVLCGPSHSGKTTFAKKLRGNFTIISSDEIRGRLSKSFNGAELEREVWDAFESAKCKALKEGHNVVLDACHMSERARQHSLQGPNSHHRKICVVFDLPFRTIRERCLGEKGMSLREVERMWRDFQKDRPTRKGLKLQDFDEVCFVPHARSQQRILV